MGKVTIVDAQGDQSLEKDQRGSAGHLKHADWGTPKGSDGGAFAMCLYQDAPSNWTHLVLLHGCHMTLYTVGSNPGAPTLAPAPSAQRLSWDQAEDISLHDTSERSSAAGVKPVDGGSATDSDGEVSVRRTKSVRPLSKLTSALRADLDLLVRCVSAPAQLADVADSISAPRVHGQLPPNNMNSPKTPATDDLSTVVKLRIKTGPRSQHHSKTPRAPKPQDSADLGQVVNSIRSASLSSASGQNRRVSFAELDEVVDGVASSARYPPSPHPRKISGAAAVPQRSALKTASPAARLSNSTASNAPHSPHELVLITALRATVSADNEQPATHAVVPHAAAEQVRAGHEGSLVDTHHSKKDTTTARGGAQLGAPGATENSVPARSTSALQAKVARLKAHWSSMLKPAAAAAGEAPVALKGSEQNLLPDQGADQLIRAKSSSAPSLGRPSLVHQLAARGPVVESRITGWAQPGTGPMKLTAMFSRASKQSASVQRTGHAHGQASRVMLEGKTVHKSSAGLDSYTLTPAAAAAEDESDSDWLPLADLWGPTVCVLPAVQSTNPTAKRASTTTPPAASIMAAFPSPGSVPEESLLPASRGRPAQRGPGPVAEAVEEETENENAALMTPAASIAEIAVEEGNGFGELPQQMQDEEEEASLTLDQQLSIERPRASPRPGSSGQLPRQVLEADAEAAGSLDRYYSLPATLSLPPTVSLDAPLLQSRTSLLPGAWASGAYGDALDEFFLDSPTMLDGPVRI